MIPFLKEKDLDPQGNEVSSSSSEFTLDQLSSIKVNPQVRSPIPGTGTIIATLYIPASGEEYDLSPYFDYNKEYLSFPLTDITSTLNQLLDVGFIGCLANSLVLIIVSRFTRSLPTEHIEAFKNASKTHPYTFEIIALEREIKET